MIQNIFEHGSTLAKGSAAIGGMELLQVTPIPPSTNLETVVKIVGQIVIAIATVWHLFKKKKTGDQ
jgi:hypothetical protein